MCHETGIEKRLGRVDPEVAIVPESGFDGKLTGRTIYWFPYVMIGNLRLTLEERCCQFVRTVVLLLLQRIEDPPFQLWHRLTCNASAGTLVKLPCRHEFQVSELLKYFEVNNQRENIVDADKRAGDSTLGQELHERASPNLIQLNLKISQQKLLAKPPGNF